MTTKKKPSHYEEHENALSFEKEHVEEAHAAASVTPGTLVKYFIKPGEQPLAAFVASVNGSNVNLMVLEQSGVNQNATDVPFVTGKAAPHPDQHYCTKP